MGTEVNVFNSNRPFNRCVSDMTKLDFLNKDCNYYADNNWQCGNFDQTSPHSLQILIVALAMVRDLILHQMMPLRNL